MFTINSYTSNRFLEELKAKSKSKPLPFSEATIKEMMPAFLQSMKEDTNRNVYDYIKTITNNHPGVKLEKDHITLTNEAVLLLCAIYDIPPYEKEDN